MMGSSRLNHSGSSLERIVLIPGSCTVHWVSTSRRRAQERRLTKILLQSRPSELVSVVIIFIFLPICVARLARRHPAAAALRT